MPTKTIPPWHPFGITADENDPLPTTVLGISIITFYKEDSISAVAAGTNTIVTQAYVAGTFENFVLGYVSGSSYAKYYLKVNGTTIATLRTSPTYNEKFDFTGSPYALSIGDTVTIEEEHSSGSHDFEATIFGYG